VPQVVERPPAARLSPPPPPPPAHIAPPAYRPVNDANGDRRPAWVVDDADLPLAEPVEPEAQPGLVVVRFQRSGDTDRDRRRLVRVHGVLVEFPGADHFRIVLCGQGAEVALDFPNHTTGYGETLVAELHGLEGIEVIWQPPGSF